MTLNSLTVPPYQPSPTATIQVHSLRVFTNISDCHNREEGSYWHPVGRGQDPAKHPMIHTTASPMAKNYLAQSVNGVHVEKPHPI